MKNRNTEFLKLREPQIGETSSQTSTEELFQNKTLRPILKLQNDLFIQVFIQYSKKQKSVFFNLSNAKKEIYIENALLKDFKFRDFLLGIIVGLFTTDEFKEYTLMTSSLHKRIIAMLQERLKSQLDLLIEN